MKSGLLIVKGDPGYKMIKRAFELEPLRGFANQRAIQRPPFNGTVKR